MQWFQKLTSTIADSLWQKNCPICNRPADLILCRDCDRQIAAHQSPEFLQKDHPINPHIPLYSWGIYDGALKRAIAACKYENHPEIMQAIAIKIADQWQRSPMPNNTKKKKKSSDRSHSPPCQQAQIQRIQPSRSCRTSVLRSHRFKVLSTIITTNKGHKGANAHSKRNRTSREPIASIHCSSYAQATPSHPI